MGSIRDSLGQKHAKDVFIEECNLGSAHNGCRRMDAWVLVKTWSPWTTIGYEIKQDRGDFLRDRKWQEYLPVCHELYFVCPAKLIAPEELPQDVGLLWTTGGTRLVTKRKAVRREPDPKALSRLMSYALMSRSRIVGDMWEAQNTEAPREFWQRWLQDRRADYVFGQRVSRAVREELSKAKAATHRAEAERDRLQSIQERLEALGLGDCRSSWEIERRLSSTAAAPSMRRIASLAAEIRQIAAPASPGNTE